ncbi:hypothetical protein MNBD_GAMMA23-2276 [hydrothermal vent metagenome]|uniref:Fibronectin type-III domain-containing protein n=1 Tax=hydrothermal vent metagenome TaxID=652676 RepID=A0A3B0ZM29_9ZZZZ
MLKQIHRFIFITVLSTLLFACGGGGGTPAGNDDTDDDGSASNNAPVATDVAFSVLPGNSFSGILAVSDEDGDSLTYSIVTTPGNGNVSIDDATTGAYTYTHAGAASGDSFTFWANDGLLDSNIATVSVSTSSPAAPASGLQAIAGDQRITLNWDAVPFADSYTVYWSNIPGSGTGGTAISNVSPPFYHEGVTDHDSLTNGTNYYYVVTAVNVVGESSASAEVTATPVDILLSSLSFTDTALSACVNASGATYVRELVSLNCSEQGIVSLVGIENLTSLTSLSLSYNSISDVTPLAGMTRLTNLSLYNNNISDVTPLAGMTRLTSLTLYSNSISDVTPLAGLTSLTALLLDANNIIDITPLAGMTSLTSLSLNNNSIIDITPLAGMTSLTSLSLNNNSIIDITPLAGMTNLYYLVLSINSISDVTPLAGMTNLFGLSLNNNSIIDVTPLAGMTSLIYLRLSYNSFGGQNAGNVDTLTGLINAARIYLFGNTGMSCSELTTLINVLGSPPVDTDNNAASTDVATNGVNCTNP